MPRVRISVVLEGDNFQPISYGEFTETAELRVLEELRPGELVNDLIFRLTTNEMTRQWNEAHPNLATSYDAFAAPIVTVAPVQASKEGGADPATL